AGFLGAGQAYPSVHALQGCSATLMRLQFNRREAMAKLTRTNPEGISKPFSNYSHMVTAEGAQKLVFCAGQVGADVDGKVLPPDDFDAQAKMVMENLTKALAAGGAKISDVTKITIYICNPHDVPKARGL